MLRINPKKYAWSPALRNAAIVRKYWKLRLREGKAFTRLQQKRQRQDPTFCLPMIDKQLSIKQISTKLTAVTQVFRRAQLCATDLRLLTYEQLLIHYNEEDTNASTINALKRKSAIVQKTIDSETNREVCNHIRDVIKPSEFSALQSQIEVSRH